MQTRKRAIIAVCALSIVAAGGTAVWWQAHDKAEQAAAKKRLVYQPGGYGGFAARNTTTPSPVALITKKAVGKTAAATGTTVGTSTAAVPAALTTARDAYAQGHYKEAEQAAKKVVASAPKQGRPTVAVASAKHLMAFSAARQGDLKMARERFAEARADAETLPAASPTPSAPGEMPGATLAEDSAYQHAVCTMALGDKAAAEREFVQFMRDFPQSSLVHGSMRRIARMHGGDIPKDVEAVWKNALTIQSKAQEEHRLQAAMCAPECLAELLRRRGESVSLDKLAREMKTDDTGSSLAALQEALRRHGYGAARGVLLTQKGLLKQSLPMIALIQPGHFVVVDKIAPDGSVTFWDKTNPAYTLSAQEWRRNWQGIALTTATPAGMTSSANGGKVAAGTNTVANNETASKKSEISGTSRTTR